MRVWDEYDKEIIGYILLSKRSCLIWQTSETLREISEASFFRSTQLPY